MIKRNNAVISKFIIHKVGNKFNDTRNLFSEKPVIFDEDSYNLMQPFLLKPFVSTAESYRFHHHADISLNEINSYCQTLFKEDLGDDEFTDISKNIVKHLYEQSNSANIKTGEVLVAVFNDIEYNGILTTAAGIFKIENKSEFFQTFVDEGSIDVMVQKGISTKKIDKGALIINSSDDEGFAVLSVDNNNYDTQYWTNHFLNIKYADDKNNHTKTYIEMCRDFSSEVLRDQYGTQEQNAFLAKTIDYFKENDTVNIHDFKEQLFEEEKQKELFDEYKKDFETEHQTLVRNQFHVSDIVVKKQKQKIKTDIKLDTNIQIKLDIDAPEAASEYLELGYDEEKKMRYYKVYFNEEKK